MKLVRYECGCVGFEPDESEEGPVLIECCDDDEKMLGLSRRRGVDGKPFEEINLLAVGEYLRKLNELIRDGYALRDLRRALGLCGIDVTVKRLKDAVDLLQHGGGES